MVKVSIIMPVYNGEEYLKNSISSVDKQTLKDIELICVNDGSTDDSLNILNELSDMYPFIKIFSQDNSGSGKARNFGIDNASGEYIAFLDADDIFIDENALKNMFNFACRHNAKMVGGNLKRINSENKILENPNYKYGNYKYFSDYDVIAPEEYGIPWAFYKNIFKRDFLIQNNIKFPDLKRGQDPVFLAKIMSLIDVIYVSPVTLYGYNYSIAGKPENKINTLEKKLDYINHFKQVIDILDESGFLKLSNEFKKKLIEFLNLAIKNNDFEVYNVFKEVFSKKNHYFKEFENEIDNIDTYFSVMLLRNCNSQKEFESIKNNLIDKNLWSNYVLSNDLLHELVLIFSSNTIGDYNLYKEKFIIDSLNVKNKKLLDDNKKLSQKNRYLRKKWKKVKSIYDLILSSKSWRITKIFRKIFNI